MVVIEMIAVHGCRGIHTRLRCLRLGKVGLSQQGRGLRERGIQILRSSCCTIIHTCSTCSSIDHIGILLPLLHWR
jgi:hypothetical protein